MQHERSAINLDINMKQTAPATIILLAIAMMMMAPTTPARADDSDPCTGHQLLAVPRPEGSCLQLKPQVFPSPDRRVRAIVFPVGMDLHASPDIESRVVMRGANATLLNSKDYSSPRGTNGYYVVHASWSPDSEFFVYTTSSSGGHSPWSFPMWVYSRERNLFVSFSDLIGGKPTVSDDFRFSGPHTVTAMTVEKIGSDKQMPVEVDLAEAVKKAAPASDK
jgi:hypothetical protein